MKVCQTCGRRFEGADWQCPACGGRQESLNGIMRFAPGLAAANNGFGRDSFAHLAEQEAGSFWFRSRNRLIIWALRKYFTHARSLLEIGCGTGFVLADIQRALPYLELAGSEIYDEGLVFARQRARGCKLYQMDARAMPFEAEFDVVGAFDVLEHIDEDQVVLQEMFRTVKKGGGILLTVPQHPRLWSEIDAYSFHKRRYRRRDLLRKVREAGFRVERVTSFVSLLLPLMVLSRMSRRKVRPGAELTMPHSLDRALERIMDLERGLIQCGLPFPMGGSLLVVARRN